MDDKVVNPFSRNAKIAVSDIHAYVKDNKHKYVPPHSKIITQKIFAERSNSATKKRKALLKDIKQRHKVYPPNNEWVGIINNALNTSPNLSVNQPVMSASPAPSEMSAFYNLCHKLEKAENENCTYSSAINLCKTYVPFVEDEPNGSLNARTQIRPNPKNKTIFKKLKKLVKKANANNVEQCIKLDSHEEHSQSHSRNVHRRRRKNNHSRKKTKLRTASKTK